MSFVNRVRGRAPSSVTTRVSSTRTPPCPGRYTPGSTVTTKPGARIAVPSWLTVGASWMSSPTPWPVPCSKRSAQPASAMICRQTSSTSLALTPGRTAAAPAAWDVADHVEDAGQLALGLGVRRRTSGSCRSGTPRRWRRSRPRRGRRASMRRGARVVVRLGRVLAGGHDRLEGRALGAAPAHGRVELEREVLLGDRPGPGAAAPRTARRRRWRRPAPCGRARRRPCAPAAPPPRWRWRRAARASRSSAQVRWPSQLTLSASSPTRATSRPRRAGPGPPRAARPPGRSRCRPASPAPARATCSADWVR